MKVCWISNIFDPKERSEFDSAPGQSVSSYAPPGWRDNSGVVEVNGKRLEPDEWGSRVCGQHDEVIFARVPGAITGGFVATLIIQLVLLGATAAISYALRPKPPRLRTRAPNRDQIEPSPEFVGVQTTIGPGNAIPVILGGPVRVGGQIIEAFPHVQYETQGETGEGQTVIQRLAQSIPGTRTQNTTVAWSHGPIESLEKFEIDDNPVENITGVEYESVFGTRDQAPLSGSQEAKNERLIGTSVTNSGGTVTVSTITEVTFVEIRLLFQAGLYDLASDGTVVSQGVTVRFEYEATNTGSNVLFEDVVFGAASQNPTAFWVKIPLDRIDGIDRYDIKVTRVTADGAGGPSAQDEFIWDKLVEARPGDRAHPGIAMTKFEQIPPQQAPAPRKYTALAKGLNDVRVYTSDDPNGYTEQWTDDPGFNFLRFLTDPFFGSGKFYNYDDNVDLQSFVDLYKRNQTLVDDGTGTGKFEKRNLLGIEIKQSMGLAEVRQICETAADASFVEEAGVWRAVPNDVTPFSKSFNDARIVPGSIKRRFLSTRERPNRITGKFRNSSRNYKQDALTRTATGVFSPINFISDDENFFGVTRRGQISRSLTTMLRFNSVSDEAIEFTTGSVGIDVKVGDVVRVATHVGEPSIANGRILRVSVDQRRIELDREIDWSSSNSYEISVVHTRTAESTTMQLTNVPDLTDSWCEVASPAWASPPLSGDLYSVALTGESWELWRVEDTTLDENYRRQVAATKYSDSIFTQDTLIDSPAAIDDTVNPTVFPGPVQDLTASARKPEDSGANTSNAIDVDWSPPETGGAAASYEVYFRESGSRGWRFGVSTAISQAVLTNNLQSSVEYEIAVVGVSPSGNKASLDNATTTTVTTLS